MPAGFMHQHAGIPYGTYGCGLFYTWSPGKTAAFPVQRTMRKEKQWCSGLLQRYGYTQMAGINLVTGLVYVLLAILNLETQL
jgi:hypothetical protein